MTPEQEKALNGHIREIAKILDKDTVQFTYLPAIASYEIK
jgi:hypothetical protein